MTVVNKVRMPFSRFNIHVLTSWCDPVQTVCRIGPAFHHELPSALHSIFRMLRVCILGQEGWRHFLP